MKPFLMLLGMGLAGYAGYMTEPSLRRQLTGIEPTNKSASLASTLESVIPAVESAIDPATLAPEQLPEKVTLSEEIKFSDQSSGLTISVAAGSKAKLLRINGKNAVVRPGDTAYTISLPIDKTDLLAQLAAHPPQPVSAAPVEAPAEPAPAAPAPAEPMPAAEPEPAPAPAPAGDSEEPAPMPAAEPAPAAEPPVEAAPEAAPAEQPAPAEPSAPATTGAGTDVVKVMQESIRSGQVKEFTFDQVQDWEAAADETVDGEAYNTGVASYKAETIFGVKTIQAKALIKGGKVQRWIWPKSGMEIK